MFVVEGNYNTTVRQFVPVFLCFTAATKRVNVIGHTFRGSNSTRLLELLAWLGIEDLDLILKERLGSAGRDTWNAPTVQSRQPLTYRLLESVGLGEAQDDLVAADREGLQRVEALSYQPS